MPSQKRERQSRLETVKTAKSIGTGPYNVNDEKTRTPKMTITERIPVRQKENAALFCLGPRKRLGHGTSRDVAQLSYSFRVCQSRRCDKNPENDPPKGHVMNNFCRAWVSEDANVSFSGCV
jgi:hypothetical protein